MILVGERFMYTDCFLYFKICFMCKIENVTKIGVRLTKGWKNIFNRNIIKIV